MSTPISMPATPDPTLANEPPVTRVVVTSDRDGPAASRTLGWARPALALLAMVWLGGHLGESRFAMLVAGEGLRVSDDFGLASGFRSLVAAPGAMMDVARLEPGPFGLGFLLLLLPVAGLVAARPSAERSAGTTALAASGAVLALFAFLGILLWLGGTGRGDVLAAGLLDAKQFPAWIERLEAHAGLDCLLLLASAAWTALAFRLPLPRWATLGTGAIGLLTTFACWYGGAGTLGSVEQFERPRPMVFAGTSDAAREPVLGTIGGHPVAMGGGEFPGLHSVGESRMAFSSPQSLREFLTPPVE
jgi:hypothetical protein